MAEDDGNPCEFEIICDVSWADPGGCKKHDDPTTCPVHILAKNIRKDLAEKVKEKIRKLLAKSYDCPQWTIADVCVTLEESIDQLLQDGGD